MKTYQKIQLRAYDVRIHDNRTGIVDDDTIVFSKQQLQAAALVGESITDLIYRHYNRLGIGVLEINRPYKQEVELDLSGLYEEATRGDPEVNA